MGNLIKGNKEEKDTKEGKSQETWQKGSDFNTNT